MDFSKYLKGFSKKVDNILNNTLENNKVEIAKCLLYKATRERVDTDISDELLNQYKVTLSIMIDELLESEKCRYIDINYLSAGYFSDVYEIGSKVIKIGGPRETYLMPNHHRILQPLTRTNFIDEKNGKEVFACVEIADKVGKLEEKDMTDENLYQIYKELRVEGIIWADSDFRNMGKLIKRNVPNLNGEDMYVFPNSLGFGDNKKETTLNEGDLVIIDTDFIYLEGENIKWTPTAEKLEKRYQQEIADKIAEKFKNNENNKEKLHIQNERI